MEEIRRLDQRLFLRELARPGRLVFLAPALFAFYAAFTVPGAILWVPIGFWLLGWYGWVSWQDSVRRRFISTSYAMRWTACKERLEAFEAILKKLRRDQLVDLQEMPQTVRRVAEAIYIALRKADLVSDEISKSELKMQTPAWAHASADPQSVALYQIADRNIAEYRSEFAAVMAGVHRTEAQSAVFMTTLDSLRIKMLGYRLRGKKPELPSQDFLESLAEARLQFASIDKALDELDLSHYPRQISVIEPEKANTDQESHLRENA